MRKLLLVTIITLGCFPATAQQPDVDTLQKAVAVLQSQRNAAQDAAADAEIRAARLADQVAKLKGEIAELKKKLPAEEK